MLVVMKPGIRWLSKGIFCEESYVTLQEELQAVNDENKGEKSMYHPA